MTCQLSPAAQQRGVYDAGRNGIHNGGAKHENGPVQGTAIVQQACCIIAGRYEHGCRPVGRAQRRRSRRMAGASVRAGRRAPGQFSWVRRTASLNCCGDHERTCDARTHNWYPHVFPARAVWRCPSGGPKCRPEVLPGHRIRAGRRADGHKKCGAGLAGSASASGWKEVTPLLSSWASVPISVWLSCQPSPHPSRRIPA